MSRIWTNLSLLMMLTVLTPNALAEESFVGDWHGEIRLPGMALGIQVHLNYAEDWTGEIDIPAQQARAVPLGEISVQNERILFKMPGIPGDPSFDGTRKGDAIAGTYTQSGQSFEFSLTRGAAELRRPQDPVPPFPYKSEEVRFSNQDVTLAGTLTLPKGEGPFPGLVLLTGSGPQNRDEEIFNHRPFWVIADHLSRHGVAVLRFDDRGVGDSGGEIGRSTTEDYAGDALAAVALLGQRPKIASDRIGLLGHSEGAASAPLAGSQSEAVAFVILLAGPGVPTSDLLALQVESLCRADGFAEEVIQEQVKINRRLTTLATAAGNHAAIRAEIRELILRQNELAPAESRPAPAALEALVQGQIDQLFTPWSQYFLRYEPEAALRKLRIPVLALNGELDLQVIHSQNLPAIAAALDSAGNPDFTIRSFPGLNHMFQHATTGSVEEYGQIQETISREVLDVLTQWIRERFVKTKP